MDPSFTAIHGRGAVRRSPSFVPNDRRMRSIATLFPLLPLALAAQTTWQVEAGGSTAPGSPTQPYYDPMELTIEVGDIVHWTGVSGSHNVYAEQDVFPDNPEGFHSGDPVSNLNYTRTFTLPGVYMYHCTQNGHATTQHGMITVTSTQQVEEVTDLGRLVMFPVPADGQLTVEMNGNLLRQAEVIAVDGRVLLAADLSPVDHNVIGLGGLAAGRYLLRLTDTRGHALVRTFLKN